MRQRIKIQICRKLIAIVLVVLAPVLIIKAQNTINLRSEYSKTLIEFSDALLDRQISDSKDENFGAIKCSHCGILHTRAAEAVYPFAVSYKITKNKKYLSASTNLANWLINRQSEKGFWKETPEEWTGTTTDQMLMLVLAFNIIKNDLPESEQNKWKNSIEKAADYLTEVMGIDFASINYCATTTASLTAAHNLLNKKVYVLKAKELAAMIISKMDDDYFIQGEGGKVHNSKYGVDLGYNLEMSLWGLGYYALKTYDEMALEMVKKALANHVYFIYPDGSMDNSWGIRSNKWTTYGSATSDGCQILFTMFADENPMYPTAAYENLQSIRRSINKGLLGYGPMYWQLFKKDPCIYPTFAKAKNLALAYEFEQKETREKALLPTQQTGWCKYFKTIDVFEARTQNFMATVTASRYKDIVRGAKSKYMYRPTGGSISNLWLKDHGYLQASSQTEYSRVEPMHFSQADGIKCLTPRIEYTDSLGYFTNLFEFDGIFETEQVNKSTFKTTTGGELKDKNQYPGGIGYKLEHCIKDDEILKTITIYYRTTTPEISLIEPVIDYEGMFYKQLNDSTVLIKGDNREIELRLYSQNATVIIGKDREKYWYPYPSLKAFPIEIKLKPEKNKIKETIKYSFKIIR